MEKAGKAGVSQAEVETGRQVLHEQVRRVCSSKDPNVVEDARKQLAEIIVRLQQAMKP
ncbi:MAG: hypothetical protein JXA11_14290 [Phycisphaerae bacterium]|nr:hypothetical protein [Phycisphaerae bacterium]